MVSRCSFDFASTSTVAASRSKTAESLLEIHYVVLIFPHQYACDSFFVCRATPPCFRSSFKHPVRRSWSLSFTNFVAFSILDFPFGSSGGAKVVFQILVVPSSFFAFACNV